MEIMKSRQHSKHDLQITSLYNYFPILTEQQIDQKFRQETKKQIIKLLLENGDLTDREMSDMLGHADPNKIRPRRHELMKAGILEEAIKRLCTVGKKQSISWRINMQKLNEAEE